MNLWPSRAPAEGATSTKAPIDLADTGVTDVDPDGSGARSAPAPSAPARPVLLRNQQSQPPPPSGIPPPPQAQQQQVPGGAGPQQPGQPPDSLSLAQLRRIVAEFPRTEPIAYDYVYADTGSAAEEIDEWFVYNFWQWVRLNTAQRNFYAEWADTLDQEFVEDDDGSGGGPGGGGGGKGWDEADDEDRRRFVTRLLRAVHAPRDAAARAAAVGALVYLVLGRWSESIENPKLTSIKDAKVRSAATPSQLAAMKAGVELVAECGGFPVIWDAMRSAFEPFWNDEIQQSQAGSLQGPQDELMNIMTIMYMALQQTLSDPFGLPSVQSQLLALQPGLLQFMLHATAKLRWDEAATLPHTQVFLLFWKCILLVFGGTREITEAKKETSESKDDDKEREIIMASPLDYHIFRQEITSKYPAYIPPQQVIPLEAEDTSLLPPLPNHPARNLGANGILPSASLQSGGASILHQPVHIATPAPSPPPSPGVGGKGGKKQNYQTNQNFPFMYPPLDATSNSAGGKGGAGLQDLLVGRKWEGSDVPASILEAGELFSQRVRMTRAARQLWEEREKFLRFERGWEPADDDLLDQLDLSSLTLEEKEALGLSKPKLADEDPVDDAELKVDTGPRPDIGPRTRERLEAVEKFYDEALPHLQSLVIVLLKAIIAIASNLFVQTGNGQQHPGGPGLNNVRPNGAGRGQDVQNGPNGAPNIEIMSPSEDETDAVRGREISAKAVTGIMVLLLKWLKLSHVLKFEYLTQLLLDSNYIPLVLKLFALHDVQQVVESKTDRLEHSFFYFCNFRAAGMSNLAAATTFEEDEESEDDAAPPPIKRRRSIEPVSAQEEAPSATTDSAADSRATSDEAEPSSRPEVDELGYPINPLPQEPITDFSRRNFFSLINYLRVMQKICKGKAHRNLLLVHYKSSNILRKSLKVPQQELRLYTLKLFKNQVPYCGRKWRQSNMRVITAVYLHCRPELRDEWLAGSDVDAEVEEALPLEQALRSLTHWFNVRRYPDKMAPEVRAALREEQDFFVRELDRIDLTWTDVGAEESVAGSEWDHEGGW